MEDCFEMKIYTDIVADYLEGKDLASHEAEWFFLQPGYRFEAPDTSEAQRAKVKKAFEQTLQSVQNFVPGNRAIWDALFPGWNNILQNTTVALIVGYPEPNDAVVMKSPAGVYTAILDMGLWAKYLDTVPVGKLVHNLLTHELCHVCIHQLMPELDKVQEAGEYLSKLDAFTFDEGFAHFVSYNGLEASEVDWDSEKLRKVWLQSRDDMLAARKESRSGQQEEWLERAIFGHYYDKYACMCGMLYLARCWQEGGITQLAKEFAAGWQGFSEKASFL